MRVRRWVCFFMLSLLTFNLSCFASMRESEESLDSIVEESSYEEFENFLDDRMLIRNDKEHKTIHLNHVIFENDKEVSNFMLHLSYNDKGITFKGEKKCGVMVTNYKVVLEGVWDNAGKNNMRWSELSNSVYSYAMGMNDRFDINVFLNGGKYSNKNTPMSILETSVVVRLFDSIMREVPCDKYVARDFYWALNEDKVDDILSLISKTVHDKQQLRLEIDYPAYDSFLCISYLFLYHLKQHFNLR